ncbi:MAG: AAA family ATPase [Desulfovibrio sp.]|nr:AAA family ATPase [Desulfovibrio sp.]
MESCKLPTLPVSLANFSLLRRKGRLYVDKTALLQKLIEEGDYYFLARPRRFGKSLTISTLEAMFRGHAELFTGLAAKAWVERQSSHPSPVLSLDLSSLGSLLSQKKINQGLALLLTRFARQYGIDALPQEDSDLLFSEVLERVSGKYGPVAVLIDEYDSPMLNYLEDTAKVQCFRNQLRSFFLVLKSCSQYLRFVFITGISFFTKAGIFSALNNLRDISTDKNYSTLTGYTQAELEDNFSLFIADAVQQKVALSKADLLQKIRKFYDGFCFDGQTKVYNPFSLLNFFCSYRFSSYWYDSGSVSFIEKYFKTHQVESPENYHHIKVDETLLAPREIEEASPESFLYQAGYLTIAKWTDEYIILDYPNQEVLCSLSKMYLSKIYPVADYTEVGKP